jgi:proteasome lid subunit RPN8/RPN11
VIAVSQGVLEHTMDVLRTCGRGRDECVVLWTGPSNGVAVEHVVHPRHVASPTSYRVDPGWLNTFWLELARNHQSVQAQLHTHPGEAFHSSADDRGALGGHEGFLSIVIPDAACRQSLDGARAYQIKSDGWQEVALEHIVAVIP